jgi:TPR repeat protein
LLKSAQAGHPFAMLKLGDCYASGSHGLPRSAEAAELWLRRASAKGLTGANVRLLRLLADQTERNDQELAVLAREAAEAGHGEAQYLMGVFCLTGQGTLEDPVEATKWLELAAAQGVTAAVERLGAIYASGLAQEPDLARAIAAFDQATAQGDLDALTHRAILRQQGVGLQADPTQAAQEFATASEAGHAEATLQLGIAYASGLGVDQDWSRAAHFYELAHERGVPEGSFNLAHVTEQGLGVPADPDRALALFASAADRGLVAAMWARYQRAPAGTDGTLSDEQRVWLQRAARAGDTDAMALLLPRQEPDSAAPSQRQG